MIWGGTDVIIIKYTINVMNLESSQSQAPTPSLKSSQSQAPSPSRWKNCLPWNQSLVPKGLGTAVLEYCLPYRENTSVSFHSWAWCWVPCSKQGDTKPPVRNSQRGIRPLHTHRNLNCAYHPHTHPHTPSHVQPKGIRTIQRDHF